MAIISSAWKGEKDSSFQRFDQRMLFFCLPQYAIVWYSMPVFLWGKRIHTFAQEGSWVTTVPSIGATEAQRHIRQFIIKLKFVLIDLFWHVGMEVLFADLILSPIMICDDMPTDIPMPF